MDRKKRLLGIGVDFNMPEVPVEERIKTIAKVGFDAIFCGTGNGGYVKKVATLAKENGLILQSVHAPFKHVDRMWKEGNEGEDVLAELCLGIDECAENSVGILVSHVWIGFVPVEPTELGAERFLRLFNYAASRGVTVALENTEGENHLEYIRDRFSSHPAFGFCIDTGHEMCYNRSEDMIGKYGAGGKLVATHLNDNLGITGDTITWLDDYHLLPFDGKADWENIVSRLDSAGFDGILTFELKTMSTPGRTANSIYTGLGCEAYLRLAYERAEKVASLSCLQIKESV